MEIQLTIAVTFISSKNTEEKLVMHSNSDNIKFTSHKDANEIVDKLFELLRLRY